MTISKSNFIVISITMITILILFQFSNISAIYTSQAMHNKIAETEIEITADQTIQSRELISPNTYTTAIIGSSSNQEANIAEEWCIYTKRTYHRFSSLTEFSDNYSRYCKLLIVNSISVSTKEDVDILYHQSETGIHIIFTSLPGTHFIQTSEKLKKLIGIRGIYKEAFQISGMTLYDGFLLGGKTTYKKLKKVTPYFRLRSGTKTYIAGNIKNQKKLDIDNEDLPPLLWRNQTKNSFIFVVNCDFFHDHTGLGMLSAMLSETAEYNIYPIVNAQNVICQNIPYLSNENSSEISQHYYYNSKALCENVLWPDIVSILSSTGDKFNGMIAPRFEYSDTEQEVSLDSVSFYFDQNEKVSGELGLSGDQIESTSYYEEKLNYDTEIMKELAPEYVFTIFSPGDMPEYIYKQYLDNGAKDSILSSIRTLITKKELEHKPILSFYNNEIVAMANTNDGFSHTDAEDLYLKSIETALGYSSISLDFTRVIYPTLKSDDWTQLSKNLSRYLNTYWKSFRKGFDQVTVSEADQKVRTFFALNYDSFRKGNIINLSVRHADKEASFLLHLNNEKITSISGASYIEIEHGKYVINTSNKIVTIEVATDLIEE